MPGPTSVGERYDFRPTVDEIAEVRRLFPDLTVPLDFKQTAPPHQPHETARNCGEPLYYRNPQTMQFAEKLMITDLNRIYCARSPAQVGQNYLGSNDAGQSTARAQFSGGNGALYGEEARSNVVTNANPDEIDLSVIDDSDPSTSTIGGL